MLYPLTEVCGGEAVSCEIPFVSKFTILSTPPTLWPPMPLDIFLIWQLGDRNFVNVWLTLPRRSNEGKIALWRARTGKRDGDGAGEGSESRVHQEAALLSRRSVSPYPAPPRPQHLRPPLDGSSCPLSCCRASFHSSALLCWHHSPSWYPLIKTLKMKV